MPIIVDVPGVGPTEFETKEQANSYFNSKKNSEPQLKADDRSFLEKKIGELKYGGIKALQGGALENAGTVLGGVGAGILGTPGGGIGAIPMGVAGAAMGAGTGKAIEDTLLQGMGYKKPTSLGENLESTGGALARGGTAEMTGQVGGKAIGAVGNFLKNNMAPRLMTSAVKDPQLAQEMLKRNEWGTGSGMMNRADQQVSNLSNKVDKIISENNTGFNPKPVIDELQSLRKEYLMLPGRQNEVKLIDEYMSDISSRINPQTIESYVSSSGGVMKRPSFDEFSNEFTSKYSKPGVTPTNEDIQRLYLQKYPSEQIELAPKRSLNKIVPPEFKPSDAQELKKSLYKERIKQYKSGDFDPSSISAQNDMAASRGLKRGIEGISPEIGPINKDIGYNINLRDALETRLNSSNKANIVKLNPLLSGLGLLPGGPQKAFAGSLGTGVLDSIIGKTGAAVAFNKLGSGLNKAAESYLLNILNKMMLDRAQRGNYDSKK